MRILPTAVSQPSIGGRTADDHARPRTHLRDYAIAALVLTASADVLFFDTLGRPVGLSVPLYVAILTVAVAICHRRRIDRRLAPYALLPFFALMALVKNVDAKSLVVAVACLASFALAATGRLPFGVDAPAALGRFLAVVPSSLAGDIRRLPLARRRMARCGNGSRTATRTWLTWVMPLALTVGYVLLLGAGNPILERWLALIDLTLLFEGIDPGRIVFWILVAGFVWPFLRPRRCRATRMKVAARPGMTSAAIDALPDWALLVCGPAAVLRALVLFNAVFAVQTLLDAAYLWGGLKLPEGVDYAAYAHRGAYTLIATALLAAAFVLLAMRPGAAADRRIRALVYLWIGQNVLLVLSAMLRLDLYVDVYALTHWRLAAFIWMGIVAAGLVLICVRIALRRSDRWLIGANMAVLAFVFAGPCFVDADALIARFNVDHSREVSGQGVRLDIDHLASLGPAAIPAIDRFLAFVATNETTISEPGFSAAPSIRALRKSLVEIHRIRSQDWRNWTFREWRLSRYLQGNRVAATLTEPVQQVIDDPN